MVMKRWQNAARYLVVGSLVLQACINPKKPKHPSDASIDLNGRSEAQKPDGSAAGFGAGAAPEDQLQYYRQNQDIPDAYKTVEAMRSGQYWDYLRQKRDEQLGQYLTANRSGFDAFTKNPVAISGTPAVILRLLPDIMPELFSDKAFEQATGYYKIKSSDSLPFGFAYTKPPVVAGGTPSPLFVNVTCAACHTGRVIDAKGQLRMIVGAPSTVGDINGFRSLLVQAVQNPNYTVEKFTAALQQKKDGELYGADRIADEQLDKAIFLGTAQSPGAGASLLAQFKDGLLKRSAYAGQTVGAYTLKNDLRTLTHSPGHIDFGIAVSLALAPPAEVQANPTAALQKYFPAAPGVADIMSVWQQEKRSYAQWDGNLKTKLTRNLGAELGIAGDPKLVNFANGLLTTAFVEKLPAPAYPFKVDIVKAAAGRAVYEQACASCHESEKFIPLAQVGTEAGRAKGLNQDTRVLLVAALKAACSDPSVADCQAPDDAVVVPRHENPGYISLPLSGIWARAPYLHNGSVPTLYHLLVPEERPQVFQVNNFNYDQNALGFAWEIKTETDDPGQSQQGKGSSSSVVRYDTGIPGLGNGGHADPGIFFGGIDFRKDRQKLEALLEYLKTL